MKLLLDACVWGGARAELERAGHDVVWAGDWPEDPGDEEILLRAASEERVLVTLDKDFGELAVVRQQNHHGIIRLVDFPARQQARVCLEVLRLHGAELLAGALITAEPGRLLTCALLMRQARRLRYDALAMRESIRVRPPETGNA